MTTTPVQEHELDAIFAALAAERHCGLAVSGGADSMALMHLASRWRRRRPAARPCLTVLTVDHGLRAGSSEEARFVATMAAELGLGHAVLRWEGAKPGAGLQQAARAARYDLMADHARAHGLTSIVTAHHLDDQAETLLMRLARGSGLDGLAAIPERGRWAGVALHRPLLDIPSARLRATLARDGFGWVEDPSNADERFERVRLRKAMARLGTFGLTAESLGRAARRLRRAREALDASAQDFLAAHGQLAETGYGALACAAFAAAPEEIALRALAATIELVRGADRPLNLARLEALGAALRAGERAARTLGGCRVLSEGSRILVMREAGRGGLREMRLAPGEAGIWDRRFEVAVPGAAGAPVTVRALGARGLREVRARLARPLHVPVPAAHTLASFWREGTLLCVPPLGYYTGATGAGPREDGASAFVARFINAGGRERDEFAR